MKNNLVNILISYSDKLWLIVFILIVFFGIYFSIKLKGIQFNFFKIIKSIIKKENTEGINSFQTLMLSLAGRIGVGSISGIALAIYFGGPGSIFWIWILSFFSAVLTYAETYLGILYREKDFDVYKGGPAYYLKNGLGKKYLGAFYAILIIICYVVGYMSIQSNTIASVTYDIFNIKPFLTGIILSIITALVIFGGVKQIANATSKIVPIMSLIYIGIALIIIFGNFTNFDNLLLLILNDAFKIKSVTGGFLYTMLIGIQRGVFSNEAGIGTGSIAASSGNSNDAKKQGLIQVLGIYITSLLICTSTAFLILNSNYNLLELNDPNGIELANYAFNYHLGNFGNLILFISIFLFAFSTILTGYYYGESSLKYFSFKSKKMINALKILTILIIFGGTILSPTILWKFTDLFIGLLALINIYAIYKLRKKVKID